MRIHLVLTCAAIPACLFGRGSQARLSDLIITSSLLLLPAPVKGTTKRHLRDVDDDNEERVSFSSEVELAESMLPSFENISVEEWLNIKLPADNPFPNWIHYNGEGNLLASSDMANLIEEMKLTNRLNPYKTTLYDTIINQLGRKKLWQIINAGMKDESTKQLATQLSWLYSNTKPAKCFELMELNTGEKNLLASPELEHFNSYLESYNKKNPTRQVTLFGILRNHFGKKRLEDIIHAGLEDSSTLKLAQQLQWLADNKDPAEYFKLLEFTFSGKKDGNFLTNPNLVHVINYVEDFNRRHYNSQVTLFGILDNHFGRNLLSDIIQVGKEDFITLSLAMHLDRLANKKTPDDLLTDVFKSTSTNNNNNNFLGSQLFANWMAYRESFNKVYPDDQGKLFEILHGHFGKDNLAEIIRVGRTDLDTKSLAKQLEWMSDNKTPEVVFKRDFWKKKGMNPLTHSDYEQWTDFMDLYNQERPDSQTTLSKILVDCYAFSTINTRFKEARDEWFKEQEYPEDVFRMLGLDKAGAKFFTQRQVYTWFTYVDEFNENFPDKAIPMRSLLPFEDSVLIKEVFGVTALHTNPPAQRVLNSLIQEWLDGRQNPNDIFVLLRVDKDKSSDIPFDSRRLYEWIKYVLKFSSRYPQETKLAEESAETIVINPSSTIQFIKNILKSMYDSIKLAKKLPQMSGSDLEPINLDETSADRLISKLLNWLVRNKQQSYYKNAIQGKGTKSAKSKEPAKTKESKKRKSMESAETKESKKRKSKESKKRKSKESAETKESKKRSKQTFEKGSF